MKDCKRTPMNRLCNLSLIPHPSSLIRLCASAPLREIFFVLVLASWVDVANGVLAANWDRFRGPNGAGQSDDAGIPTKWEPNNFLWKRPLPGVGHSSPVIWGNRMFITSADPKT